MDIVAILDVTQGTWAVDLAAWTGVLVFFATLWRLVLRPIVQMVSRLVTGVERLNDLLEGDVLTKLDAGAHAIVDHAVRIDEHAARLDDHHVRITKLEGTDAHDR